MGSKTSDTGATAKSPKEDTIAVTYNTEPNGISRGAPLPHQEQYPDPFQQQVHPMGFQHGFTSQLGMAQQRNTSFDMSAMANALPQGAYQGQSYGQPAPRYAPTHPPGLSPQYGTPSTMGAMPTQQYYVPQHQQMPQFYQTMPSQPSSTVPSSYYPSPVVMSHAVPNGAPFYYTPGHPYPPHQTLHNQVPMTPGQFVSSNPNQEQNPRFRYPNFGRNLASIPPATPHTNGGDQPNDQQSNVVRGPPRKPRQSGHAIWIGNLPPQTELMGLVHHVCKVTEGLESLFLISKSNCAFANFPDDLSCSTAQRKLHDSKFMTVRLVSRLRKSTVEGPAGVTAPTGPAASVMPQAGGTTQEADTNAARDDGTGLIPSQPEVTDPRAGALPVTNGSSAHTDRFFILKSLTVEDLELSVQSGTWATQSHNEEKLSVAFKEADNVYLVFSANKSGEFFGYARMMSPMNEDPAAAIEFAPSTQSTGEVDLPKAIPTEATEFAPRGRIIDDSARGTIFWEADREGKTGVPGDSGAEEGDVSSVRSGHDGEAGTSEAKAWGKPFQLEWLSTTRLPFYRTKGLRNPWNSNREVKIARDGTELEPSIGRILISSFNRMQSPAMAMMPPVAQGMGPVNVRMQVPAHAVSGYPPLR
ncbi:zinc finger CCCH domain-containing protein 45 [Dichotomopilus funicola]|uniref:Zinc finger CCCH domain-containing protein 45 n=1 Tax=Dichotomopilus funicola TaxID=1934379 RepID=A0AAN6V5B4_9PEZI|nr:zinc finger CCCH domain-containing protein 45 [Dichotomopilus funicola]